MTFGEFETQVKRAAEWLLKSQWGGTLFWGDWYREWDETRGMGVQEAGNGHSPLAPLYHYWRTGDARFLRCAQRSAQYVWDVQMFRGTDYLGCMFHTRRHLFDELDCIHPRYQRATGGLLASHVFLNPAARKEMIHKMSRWTAACYVIRGTRKWDDWNWNLTNYALRGLYNLYLVSHDRQVYDLMTGMMRKTLATKSINGLELKDGIGGGDVHFVFYHAWVSTRIAKLCPDRDTLVHELLSVVRREVARVRPDGLIALNHGMSSGLPTLWTSYYDAKSLVAYAPVIAAHLAAPKK